MPNSPIPISGRAWNRTKPVTRTTGLQPAPDPYRSTRPKRKGPLSFLAALGESSCLDDLHDGRTRLIIHAARRALGAPLIRDGVGGGGHVSLSYGPFRGASCHRSGRKSGACIGHDRCSVNGRSRRDSDSTSCTAAPSPVALPRQSLSRGPDVGARYVGHGRRFR